MSKFWLLKALQKVKFLKNRRIDFDLDLNGKKFTVPLIAEIGFHNYTMKELWMLDIFKKLDLTKKDILIDVGANTGQTLLKWKSVSEEAPYFGIEPIPQCADYLNDLINCNEFLNTQIVQKALFDQEGKRELYFHFDDEADRTASLIESHYRNKKSLSVESIHFQTFIDQYQVKKEDIKVVKIDVEGSELEILNNMFSFLKEHQPIILLEVLAYKPKVDPIRLEKVLKLIKDLPHQLYRVKKRGMHLNGLEQIDTIKTGTPKGQSDYILLPDGYKW